MTIKQLDEKVNDLNDTVKQMIEKQVENTVILSQGFNAIHDIKKILQKDESIGKDGLVIECRKNGRDILELQGDKKTIITMMKVGMWVGLPLLGAIGFVTSYLNSEQIAEIIKSLN